MTISTYAKALGVKSKKEIRSIAPKGAQWSDLSGDAFYKVVGTNVFCHVKDDEWFVSSMTPDMFTPIYFHKLTGTTVPGHQTLPVDNG